LTKRRGILIWLALIALASVQAGSTALRVDLTQEAGSQRLSISFFEAVPVSGALLLLQVSAALVAALSSLRVVRVLMGISIPLTILHLVSVLIEGQRQLANAAERIIADLTGVYGALEQQPLVSAISESWILLGYPISLGLLFSYLTLVTIRGLSSPGSSAVLSVTGKDSDPLEIWESQRES
jgi:hypothetical protein